MTEHRSVSTVMGYFQAGNLLNSRVTELLSNSEPRVSPGSIKETDTKKPDCSDGKEKNS